MLLNLLNLRHDAVHLCPKLFHEGGERTPDINDFLNENVGSLNCVLNQIKWIDGRGGCWHTLNMGWLELGMFSFLFDVGKFKHSFLDIELIILGILNRRIKLVLRNYITFCEILRSKNLLYRISLPPKSG